MTIKDKILEAPIEFSIAVAIVLLALGVFFKLAGNPITFVIKRFEQMIPSSMKELGGEAGATGKINLIIVFLTFFLAFAFILQPNLASLISPDVSGLVVALLVFFIAVVEFYASLRIVLESERMSRLFKRPNR